MSAFDAFVTVHQYQLSAIPEDLWQVSIMRHSFRLLPYSHSATRLLALAAFHETRRRLSGRR